MDDSSLYELVCSCARASCGPSPEKLWLGEACRQRYRTWGATRLADGDAQLFERVFGRPPATSSDVLRVRYWRTGHSVPSNRQTLLALGTALGLDDEQERYLIQSYFDRSDSVIAAAEGASPQYLRRRALMDGLRREFLDKIHPIRLSRLGISRQDVDASFRYLFVLESLSYVSGIAYPTDVDAPRLSRLSTTSYATVLHHYVVLQGELRRRDMLRTLIVLMAPFLSRERLDHTLDDLGFLPLTAGHQLPGGGRLDDLLIALLEGYEDECAGTTPEQCQAWLQGHLRRMDQIARQVGADELRLMAYRTVTSLHAGDFESRDGQALKTGGYACDRIFWMRRMTDLRQRYGGTPPAFRSADDATMARQRLDEMATAWEEAQVRQLVPRATHAPEADTIERPCLEARMNEALSQSRRLVLLHGMGGVGKSVLGRRFAAIHRDDYDAVVMLDCAQGLVEALCDDEALRFSNMHLVAQSCPSPARYATEKLAALARQAQDLRILLILDNCDEARTALYRRVFALPLDVIVTTRLRPEAWGGLLPDEWDAIEVPSTGFEEDEWERFARQLGAKEGWKAVRDGVGGNILATKLAICGEQGDATRLLPPVNSLRRSQRQLLTLMALLPTGGTPRQMLLKLGAQDCDIDTLCTLSLVEQDDAGTVRMHPLVAQETLTVLPPTVRALHGAISALANLCFNAWERTYEYNAALVPYARAILRAFPAPPAQLATDLDELITLLWITEHFDEAKRHARRLYDSCRARYGAHDVRTGFCALRRGAVLENAGNFDEARQWFAEAYQVLEQAEDPPPRALVWRIEATGRMSQLCAHDGDLDGALAYNLARLRLARELRDKWPDRLPGYRGNPSLEYPYALLKQGEHLLEAGRLAEAADYSDHALQVLAETDRSPYRRIAFDRLRTRILMSDGRTDEAVRTACACLEVARSHRGAHHRETLRYMELLAGALRADGRRTEAAALLADLLDLLALYHPTQREWMGRVAQAWNEASGHRL